MRAIKFLAFSYCIAGAALAQQTVNVVKVTAQANNRKVALPGEFMPYQAVDVRAKVAGFVERVEVDRGSVVTEGQLLATLVAPELAAQRKEAEARVQAARSTRAEAEAKLLSAQSTWERLKAASETPGAIAGNELVVAEKAVEAARAQLKAVEASIEAAEASAAAFRDMEAYLRVTAPFSGVITERNVHPGALVGPSAAASQPPMFRLEQNTRLRLVVAVPEVDVGGIARGSRVSFTVAAWPGETFSGVVARTANSMDPTTRSMAVELDVENTRGRLAPGMFPTVQWPVRKARPALMVPATAVVTTTERTFVIRVRDGAAEWVPVVKGPASGAMVEVQGALRAGDLVVERGSDELREGARLTANNPKSS